MFILAPLMTSLSKSRGLDLKSGLPHLVVVESQSLLLRVALLALSTTPNNENSDRH